MGKRKYRKSPKQEFDDYVSELQGDLVESLDTPYYHCVQCCHEFQTTSKKDMIQHYIDHHNLPVDFLDLPPTDPYDTEYIVLRHIIESMEVKKFFKGRSKYFTVSNMALWSNLCEKLNINPSDSNAPSKQMPRNILNRSGLLKREGREKKRLGYNSKGNRVYHINISDVDRAISKTNFVDLKIRLGLLDTATLGFDEPTSPTSEKNEDGDKSTGDTGKFFDDNDIDMAFPESLPDKNVGLDLKPIPKKTKKKKDATDDWDLNI